MTPTPEAVARADELVNEWCDYPGLEAVAPPSGAMTALVQRVALALDAFAQEQVQAAPEKDCLIHAAEVRILERHLADARAAIWKADAMFRWDVVNVSRPSMTYDAWLALPAVVEAMKGLPT